MKVPERDLAARFLMNPASVGGQPLAKPVSSPALFDADMVCARSPWWLGAVLIVCASEMTTAAISVDKESLTTDMDAMIIMASPRWAPI